MRGPCLVGAEQQRAFPDDSPLRPSPERCDFCGSDIGAPWGICIVLPATLLLGRSAGGFQNREGTVAKKRTAIPVLAQSPPAGSALLDCHPRGGSGDRGLSWPRRLHYCRRARYLPAPLHRLRAALWAGASTRSADRGAALLGMRPLSQQGDAIQSGAPSRSPSFRRQALLGATSAFRRAAASLRVRHGSACRAHSAFVAPLDRSFVGGLGSALGKRRGEGTLARSLSTPCYSCHGELEPSPLLHEAARSGGLPMQRIVLLALTLALSLAAALEGRAEDFPSRPLRLIIGFPPGSAADITARLVGDAMGQSLRQQMVVESRAGAGSSLAAEFVARAPA